MPHACRLKRYCSPMYRFASAVTTSQELAALVLVQKWCLCSNSSSNPHKTKAAIARGLCGLFDDAELLGCHFFGFAFLPHQLQLALGFLEGGRNFLLHAGSGFFEFLR